MENPSKNKREKFLPEEDAVLRCLVEKHGTLSWEAIAAELPGRNARQCRERWKHYLSGERLNDPWSNEEDMLLFDKMQTIGPRWTQLTQFFPGRTDIEIKSRWMQRFAHRSNLHLVHRKPLFPNFQPTILPLPGRVQFAPLMPAQAKPVGEGEFFTGTSREHSFNRSFSDYGHWEE
jgi:hypothetical protein